MAGAGVCPIKKEFILKDREKLNREKDHQGDEGKEVGTVTDVGAGAENENIKEKQAKKKQRGQNKGRPKPVREPNESKPCTTIMNVHEGTSPKPCQYEKCRFIHDPLNYLKIKRPDIDVNGGKCFVFEAKGECPWGIACRFGSSHLSADGHNIVDIEKIKVSNKSTLNNVSSDALQQLRKRKYDFSYIEEYVNSIKKRKLSPNEEEIDKKGEKDESSDVNSKETNNVVESNIAGVVTNEDIIPLKLEEKKKINWKNLLYLAPLTTLGNLPFRRVCKEFGADITCGEMALCDSLLKGVVQEWALVKKHESEDLFGVQICGNNPFIISKAAVLLEKEVNVDFIDLNLGCPIDLVYKRGAGCGLLLRTNNLEASVKCTSKLLSVPFTVKTRTGVYQDTNVAHQFAPKFAEWGASMITIHGRSREQRYTKSANWEYINQCAKVASPCPVFGNGDIMSYEDYQKAFETAPNISGVMLGRGPLIKPWVFTEIKEQKLWDIRSSERFDILKKFTNYGLEHWGSDSQGVENTRRFLLEWLSFLYRYVPVGLLERPPQRINERPPYYIGRDDLETVMASPYCEDWIKLSEMLLGPVPDDFIFLPKHKANSYN